MKTNNPITIDREEQGKLCDRALATEGVTPSSRFWEKDREFALKRYFHVELSDGVIVRIERPAIKTEFYEGEDEGMGGPTVREARARLKERTTELGFFRENVTAYTERMLELVARDAWKYRRSHSAPIDQACLTVSYSTKGKSVASVSSYRGAWEFARASIIRKLSDDDMKRVRQAVYTVRADLVRRVRAYWKRFGASKLKMHTYWISA